MRKMVMATVLAAGLGLMASSGASAAPFGAGAIGFAADAVASVIDVRGGGWHCPPVKCWEWSCKKVYKPGKVIPPKKKKKSCCK